MKAFFIQAGKIAAWTLGVLAVLFIALVIYRIPAVGQKEKAAEAVSRIHAARLTLDTVMGKHLPLPPNEEENDATVAGVDNNGNGIRDDAELAIFAKYPNSAKVRAAELQYAMTEQMFLTEVFDKETWVAVANQDSRAYDCISETYPRTNMQKFLQITDGYVNEVKTLVFNTELRRTAQDKAFDFTTSYGETDPVPCDIDLNTLSN